MYKAILSYDGTSYFGWQKTKAGPSIQEELEQALCKITGERVIPEAASRTDRGVHAEAQVVQFSLKKEMPLHRLQRGLNAILPPSIRILRISYENFHPTLDALGKEYNYKLDLNPVQDPTQRLYSWHIHYELDFSKIEQAAQCLIGTHDFSAFANEPPKDPICTIESIVFSQSLFKIIGNRFLNKMVRNLVGTLVYIGSDKLQEMDAILTSKDRKRAGVTAPAHGLYLHQVFYPIKATA